MSSYLTVQDVKAFLRIGQTDTLDDEVILTVCNAVEALQRQLLTEATFTDDGSGVITVPDNVYQAALFRAARLYARRASPEGLVGLGELGVARVPPYDRDIDQLEGPNRVVVLA